jgi:signal peptidase I
MRAARQLGRRWGRTAAAAGIVGAVALGVPATLQGVVVNGSSMVPSLRPGQFMVVVRPSYAFSAPHRGDIVVFRNPELGRDNYVKRVIGVPGDQVRIDAGQVIVNGQVLDEPYVLQTDDYSFPSNGQPVRVPRNSYFVLGDNRPVSADSHLGWFVRADQVLGQAWALPISLGSQH